MTRLFQVFFSCLILLSTSASFAASYVGIGVTIQKQDSAFFIADLIPNGPAARAGVLIGEEIKAVDTKPVAGLDLDGVSKLLAGPVGTSVVLTLQASATTPLRDVSVTREIIEIQCFLEGSASLSITGDEKSGWINGWIGRDSFSLNVSFNRASGYVKGEYVSLNIDRRFTNDFTLSGWVKREYVNWSSFGNHWNFWVPCIQ